MTAAALRWHIAAVFLLSLIVFQGAIAWLDNVHIATANGLYKSLQAAPWIANPSTARLDDSNYLYFPLYGSLCRLLDALGIWRGVAWKQFAVLNGFWASVCVTFAYIFIFRATRSSPAALLAAFLHLGSGFVLLLAVINEDIMPGYTLVFGAMALAALWFDRPTMRRVIVVAAVFTIGWLVEWRLMFPTLPAFVLALLMAPGTLRRRLAMTGMLLAAIVATTGLVCLFWEGHNGAVGMHDLLWTGKAVDSGWAGFAADKLWSLLAGMGNYLFLITLEPDTGAARAAVLGLSFSVVLQAAILVAAGVALWTRRFDSSVRAITIVFLGTAGAGEVFNVYSQPQDPQMQVNVMSWLTVAWGLLCAFVLQRQRAAKASLAVLAVLSLAPLAWNLPQLSQHRGRDSQWTGALAALESKVSPQSTVFLYWGFEPVVVWQVALWSQTADWDLSGPPPPAPATNPRFKWITVNAGAMRHPKWSGEEDAAALKRNIDAAIDLGYRVVATNFWNWSADELAGHLGILAASGRAGALHAMLHGSYDAVPVFAAAVTGRFYELKRR